MHNPIRIAKTASLLASLTVFAAVQANAQLPQIGVEFLGRTSTSPNPATPGVAQSDVAGVIPMSGWNVIDNAYADPTSANVGESLALLDTNLNTTAVTITYNGNDSWNNDVDPNSITTPNAKLMNGTIKSNGSDGVKESFQFNHVPEGTYDFMCTSMWMVMVGWPMRPTTITLRPTTSRSGIGSTIPMFSCRPKIPTRPALVT